MREIQVRIKIYLPEFVCRLCLLVVLHYRKMRYGYTFRRIPLTRGQFAIVDVEDYERLSKYKWYAGINTNDRDFYAKRINTSNDTRPKTRFIMMHREILNVPDGLLVDHINHNTLDNRRANLRPATKQQNSWNQRKKRGNYTSRYKGVHFNKSMNRWGARLVYNGKDIPIGYFDDEKSAARAYDAKASELFGEFATPNFPSDIQSPRHEEKRKFDKKFRMIENRGKIYLRKRVKALKINRELF